MIIQEPSSSCFSVARAFVAVGTPFHRTATVPRGGTDAALVEAGKPDTAGTAGSLSVSQAQRRPSAGPARNGDQTAPAPSMDRLEANNPPTMATRLIRLET
jgi:hypothetical protein